jgi:hypothetical protein
MFSWLNLSSCFLTCTSVATIISGTIKEKKELPKTFQLGAMRIKFRIQWIKLYEVESGNGACNDAICTFILRLLAYMFLLIWMEHLTGIMSNQVIRCIIASINHMSITGMRIKMVLVMVLIYTMLAPCNMQAQPQQNSRHVILFSTDIMVQLTLDEIGTFITSNRSQSWLVGTQCLPGAFSVRSIFLPQPQF